MTGSVLLILTSADRDPPEVTNALGLEPFQVWRRGDRKRFVRPDGTVMLFDSFHERSGWKAILADGGDRKSLQDQAQEWLRELASRPDALSKLRELGWESELNCFSAGSAELELEPDELARLGRLGVRLAVFAHCQGDDHEEGESEPTIRREPD